MDEAQPAGTKQLGCRERALGGDSGQSDGDLDPWPRASRGSPERGMGVARPIPKQDLQSREKKTNRNPEAAAVDG